MPTGLHGRYEQGANQCSAVPWRPPRATPCAASQRLLRALVQAQPAFSRWMASNSRPRIAVAGRAAPRGYPDTPENHLPWSLHRHVSDHLRCSKQSRFFRRVLSILPPSPLSATAHLQPLAQPTALRHPGSRCDIDSHPDCRPILILIVAPQTSPSRLRRRFGNAGNLGAGTASLSCRADRVRAHGCVHR